jgi:putative membrane protein
VLGNGGYPRLALLLYVVGLTFLSAALVNAILAAADRSSIASLRRILALITGGNLVWLLCTTAGWFDSLYTGTPSGLVGGTFYGAFLAAGFEFTVLRGAFAKSHATAITTALIHPALISVGFWLLSDLNYSPTLTALVLGAITILVAFSLPFSLDRIRTNQRDSPIPLFQAFLKTWVNGDPTRLEQVLEKYTEQAEITTKLVRFSGSPELYLVLPGIHPGPFYPVGSYNLPGLIFSRFQKEGSLALTLHRPGGHERNLATSSETALYVDTIFSLAKTNQPEDSDGILGPSRARIGNTMATSFSLSKNLLMLLSSSPFGTDDVDLEVEQRLTSLGKAAGFRLSLVDAHNSINSQREVVRVDDVGPWNDVLDGLRQLTPEGFRVGFAHSSEIKFDHMNDISEAGVGVIVFEIGGSKWVLVVADSNNAETSARSSIEGVLRQAGFQLLELCTTDSHNLAARGLTINRGYFALAERTPIASINQAVVNLTRLAEGRLSPRKFSVSEQTAATQVLGAGSIGEFASIAQRSSSLAKTFLKVSIPAYLAMLALAIVTHATYL